MRRVFLAAGHHPPKPGACYNGRCEYDIASVWVDKIACSAAARVPILVVPTGTLQDKTEFINARLNPGDIAVELHFNSAKNASGEHIGNGAVTLYYPGSTAGQYLAEKVQAVMAEVFPPDRGIVEGWYRGDRTRGPYYFLKRTKCPALILEPQFIHHEDEIDAKAEQFCESIASVLSDIQEDT
jgi:N-acetylmuramoyl-L-alanine amidase